MKKVGHKAPPLIKRLPPLAPAMALTDPERRFMSSDEILEDDNPKQRFKEIGRYALDAALAKHLSDAYPDLSPEALAALRDANLSDRILVRAAQRFQAEGRVVWPKDRDDDFLKAYMRFLVVCCAGCTYVNQFYNLDKFWEKFSGYMEPVITPQELESLQPIGKAPETDEREDLEVACRIHLVLRMKGGDLCSI